MHLLYLSKYNSEDLSVSKAQGMKLGFAGCSYVPLNNEISRNPIHLHH